MRHGFVARHFNEQAARARREENRNRQINQRRANQPENLVREINQLANHLLNDPNDEDIDLDNEINILNRANQIRNNIIRQQENIRIAREELARRDRNDFAPDPVDTSDSEDEQEQGHVVNVVQQRQQNQENNQQQARG
jgi:ribosomal protein S15P/S13E